MLIRKDFGIELFFASVHIFLNSSRLNSGKEALSAAEVWTAVGKVWIDCG